MVIVTWYKDCSCSQNIWWKVSFLTRVFWIIRIILGYNASQRATLSFSGLSLLRMLVQLIWLLLLARVYTLAFSYSFMCMTNISSCVCTKWLSNVVLFQKVESAETNLEAVRGYVYSSIWVDQYNVYCCDSGSTTNWSIAMHSSSQNMNLQRSVIHIGTKS